MLPVIEAEFFHELQTIRCMNLYKCDAFDFNKAAEREFGNLDTGACREFAVEIGFVYFINCGKIIHAVKENRGFYDFALIRSGFFQNGAKILHRKMYLLFFYSKRPIYPKPFKILYSIFSNTTKST